MRVVKRVKYPTTLDEGEFLLPNPPSPFSSINLELLENSSIRVIAQIAVNRLLDEKGGDIENARFAIALDGSASMLDLFGTVVGPFGYGTKNQVEPVAQSLIKYLCDFSGDGKVDVIYWSVGRASDEIEEKGQYSDRNLTNVRIGKPTKKLGRRTLLRPALEYFEKEVFAKSPWSMGLIITDGAIDDMDDVLDFTEEITKKIKSGEFGSLKLVLIGVGNRIDHKQLEKLDNYISSAEIDLWDTSSASKWEGEDGINDIFKEVMSTNLIIAPYGRILNDQHAEISSKKDGFPANIDFILPSESTGFILDIADKRTRVDLKDGIQLLK